MLAAVDECVVLQVARQLARGGQREPELAGQLAHGARPLGRDVREHGEVAAAEGRFLGEREKLVRRPARVPEPAQHPPQQLPDLTKLLSGNTHALVIVILR
jgi:hypothetical protein